MFAVKCLATVFTSTSTREVDIEIRQKSLNEIRAYFLYLYIIFCYKITPPPPSEIIHTPITLLVYRGVEENHIKYRVF